MSADAMIVGDALVENHEHSPVCKTCGEDLDSVPLGADGRPTSVGWRKIGERLRKPMPTHQARKTGGTYHYLKSRQIVDRLDAVVGPGNWAMDVKVVRAENPVAVLVGIGLFGVWKWDAGYSNNPESDDPDTDKSFEHEPLKAAITDGQKRAAMQWGVGRWLRAGNP